MYVYRWAAMKTQQKVTRTTTEKKNWAKGTLNIKVLIIDAKKIQNIYIHSFYNVFM